MKQLSGARIAVTRPAAQSRELVALLEEQGAQVVVCPLIRIDPGVDAEAVRRVWRDFDDFAWLIFTSANGVDQFMRLVAEAKSPGLSFRGKHIACVGPATADAARGHGLAVDVVPAAFTGDAIAEALAGTGDLRGKRVLIARARGGGAGLPAGLRAAGALVDDLELYRSVADPQGARQLAALAAAGQVDVVTFTSGSAVRYFADTITTPGNLTVAVIGPSTAEVARSCGLRVDIEANPHTTAGLVTAILEHFGRGSRPMEV
jgi:uroporphyrinogen III methyltransferase/synthase